MQSFFKGLIAYLFILIVLVFGIDKLITTDYSLERLALVVAISQVPLLLVTVLIFVNFRKNNLRLKLIEDTQSVILQRTAIDEKRLTALEQQMIKLANLNPTPDFDRLNVDLSHRIPGDIDNDHF